MALLLDEKLRFGVQTIHRRTEPVTAPWEPAIDELKAFVQLVERCGFDALYTGDHVAFAIPILDPLLQLAQAAAFSRRLRLGTCVYLLPLRHPVPVAKQVVTLDHLTEGRLVFGVGAGGEFPGEFNACGVPLDERGSRLTEGIEVLRKLWSGLPVSHAGRHYRFDTVQMLPPARQPGGPPIWVGGRSEAALKRAALHADGWVSYVVTPGMYAESLATLRRIAAGHGAPPRPFTTAHLLFLRVDRDEQTAFAAANACLSVRYGMDFSKPTRRYGVLGTPQQVASQIRAFYDSGVRHLVLDFVGPYEERDAQLERFAADVRPLLHDLTG
jgi:probable F420-dependent oxidoreductase